MMHNQLYEQRKAKQKYPKHDDYSTPKSAWENIKEFIPKDKVIWEAFSGDGTSAQHLRDLGFNVISENVDFFDKNYGEVIITNPPYSKSKFVLERLVEYGMPFILIMPASKICTQYFRRLFSNNEDKIQIIIPRKRIHFKKLVDGKVPDGWKDACNFDCFYFTWKMNLPRDIVWLGDD